MRDPSASYNTSYVGYSGNESLPYMIYQSTRNISYGDLEEEMCFPDIRDQPSESIKMDEKDSNLFLNVLLQSEPTYS
jgi:hypothetical protein